MQPPVSFRLSAEPQPGYTLIEVTADFWSGFDTYRVECSDDTGDRKDWRPLPGSAPTILPPSGVGIWLDRTAPRNRTRWYRAVTTAGASSPVPVTPPPPPVVLRHPQDDPAGGLHC